MDRLSPSPTTRRRRARRRTLAALGGIAVAALALTGCAGAGEATSAGADGRIPLLDFGGFGGGSNPKEIYNPYLPTSLSVGSYLYDTLMATNDYTCVDEPMLATGSEWKDPQTLVYTLRDGVTFSDGEELTADDVVFSFQLVLKHKALDQRGIGELLESAEKTGDREVTLHFRDAGISMLSAANALPIVPKHVWSTVEDPTTFTNSKPVTDGSMTVESFSPTRLTLKRNPDYWNAENIRVDRIRFTNSDSGQVEQLKMGRGDYDMNALYLPDIEKSYVSKDKKHNKYWFPAASPISLYLNLGKKPFDDLAFRDAVAGAINKDSIAKDAQQGYVKAASQTSLVLPNAKDWLPAGIPDEGYIAYDAPAAKAALDKAGYKLNADGKRLGKDGQPLRFTLQIPGGWNDWIAAGKIIQKDFAALGITVDMQNPQPEVVDQNRKTGEYDLVFGVRGGTCDMYRNFVEPLASDRTAPVGQAADTNEARWSDPATDALLSQLKSATDPAVQKQLVGELATIMYEQKPYLPLWYGPNWFEYRTAKAVGWPSAENPYAKPANMAIILTHLKPAE